jgi:hypothetical protein
MCGGSKVNVEFPFDRYAPSVAQLLSRASEAFTRLFALRSIHRDFAISFSMIFDDTVLRWVPLERSSQLSHNCQVYLFQPDTTDVPSEIPDPIPAGNLIAGYASPQRALPVYESPRSRVPDTYVPREAFAYATPAAPYQTAAAVSASRQRNATYDPIEGASILREERANEDRKSHLSVDEHRSVTRHETDDFNQGAWSPSRQRE